MKSQPFAFISFAHQDLKYAEKVQETLAGLGVIAGQPLTFDPQRDLKPGEDMRSAIRSLIEKAGTFVVIATENAARSQWVNYEVGMAEALGKNIVVVGSGGTDQAQLVEQFRSRFGDVQALEVDPKV